MQCIYMQKLAVIKDRHARYQNKTKNNSFVFEMDS